MRAYVVVDLGFGDSGKGLITDFLVRHFDAGVVVRYNGGAQAGHNVVTPNGCHHTFSQFGSGTFIPNVKTFLSQHVVVDPLALLAEGDLLENKGVRAPFSRLRLSDKALIITPFHQAANRIRELVRGANRHGSCGIGVGEVVEDALDHPENCIMAGDLNRLDLLRRKLRIIRDQKQKQITELCKNISFGSHLARDFEIFDRGDVIDTWIYSIARINELGIVASDSVLEHWMCETDTVIFEGAQGVLLDADAGFHPYTTWSRCTSENAFDLIEQMSPDAHVFQIGVMRAYALRHGPGPLPTETEILNSIVSEHNKYNEWQGTVRYGWFDAVLARYALDVTGGVDSLAVTHLDILSHLETWKYCLEYQEVHLPDNTSVVASMSDEGILTGFRPLSFLSLEERARFTQALSTVSPMLRNCDIDGETVIREIELLLGQQVGIASYGPSAENVKLLHSLFS